MIEVTEPFISVKWPAPIVVGHSVTPDQAAEIIVRTTGWPLMTNARRACRRLNAIAGFRAPDYAAEGPETDLWEANAKANQDLRLLSVDYLRNWRVATASVHGPHGWCDWDGTIGCRSYNIGKWPSVEEVTAEWAEVAAAFPFLALCAQVLSGEAYGDEENGSLRPTAEWVVADGAVRCRAPVTHLGALSSHEAFQSRLRRTFTPEYMPEYDEVGATDAQVARGVELARLALALPEKSDE